MLKTKILKADGTRKILLKSKDFRSLHHFKRLETTGNGPEPNVFESNSLNEVATYQAVHNIREKTANNEKATNIFLNSFDITICISLTI